MIRDNCNYGRRVLPGDPGSAWTGQAYIYAGATYSVNWGLADKLTGTGTDDLNAIWYMMLLGGDLGWDIPQYGLELNTGYLNYPDPHLAYDNIKYGYNGPGTADAGCNGNGSTTGIESSNQALSQRLTVAQQNTTQITAAEAIGIRADLRKLKQEVPAASPDHDIEIDLASPLREAAKLIERAKLPAHQGSVSATTPTDLIELFVQRAQLHKRELGQGRGEYLLTRAYSVIAGMEGQNRPGDAAVTRCSR